MKKIALTAAVLALATAANAIEWGGLLSANEKLSNGQGKQMFDFDTNKSETTADAKAWVKVPFDESGENYAIAEGTYNFKYTRASASGSHTQYLDLDLLKVVLAKETDMGKLGFSLGRFSISDLSALVYSQNADGALAKFEGEQFSASLYGGYTGLLNGRAVTILSTGDDKAFSEDTDKIYQLAEKFAVASLSLSLPNIIGNNTISAEGLGAFRLEGDGYTRVYGTVAANGPILPDLFYRVAGTVGYKNYSKADISDVGWLAQGNATYYPDYKNASVGLGATFACKKFVGFTSQTAVKAQTELQYNGLLKAGASGSIKPLDNLLVSAAADAVCCYGTPAAGAANASGDFGFRGVQLEAGATYQLFSDVNFGASLTQFLDTNKDGGDWSKTTLELKATMTF